MGFDLFSVASDAGFDPKFSSTQPLQVHFRENGVSAGTFSPRAFSLRKKSIGEQAIICSHTAFEEAIHEG
jgi:hypothetical protein